jgi:NAD(P)-dependent dehydrogenase (short-subunit alcohol dehydrogenase family)
MMKRFEGRTILVTGAGSGIGRASAIRLAEEGARLVLVDRNSDRVAALREELGGDHFTHTCDMTDEKAITEMVSELRKQVEPFSGVVHSAGIHWLRPLALTDSNVLREMLDSHVISSIALTRALNRFLAKDGASIVWFASVAALKGGAGTVAYAAAKAALIGAARVVAVELARRGVRVNVIAPGVVKTKQSDAFLANLAPEQQQAITDSHLLGLGEPQDIAGVVAFLLSDDARWITGTTLVVDGGLSAH